MDSEIRGVVVVDLESAYDPAGLRFQLHEVVLSGARCIVVDASAVDVLPSSAIAAMLVAHRACRRRGGHLAIRSPAVALWSNCTERVCVTSCRWKPGRTLLSMLRHEPASDDLRHTGDAKR